MMPKLSGFEVCKQLKGDPATSGIMILMVTALNELGDIERAVEAGTDDFLSKPVNKLELLKRVENAQASRRHRRKRTPAALHRRDGSRTLAGIAARREPEALLCGFRAAHGSPCVEWV